MDPLSVTKQHIELRLLRYTIAVAEELHFGRAAKRLNLSAPSLSKQLKDLEHALGYLLFERKTREVLLTPAGTAFVAESRQALVRVERAVEYGYAASRGDTGLLSIGYSPWFRPSLLVALRTALGERAPKSSLVFHGSAYSSTQIELLLKGTLQAGIIELLGFDAEGLTTHCVWREELILALPEDHPLAKQSGIDRRDLTTEPIIWIAKTLSLALHQYLLESFRRSGCAPQIVHEVNTVSELLDLVGAGIGLGFVKRSIAEQVRVPGVIFRELDGPKLSVETSVSRTGLTIESEALRILIQLLREQSTQVIIRD